MDRRSSFPKSRQHGLLIDQVGDETIVYDEERQEAHSLNRPASIVWKNSDGTRSLEQLGDLLGTQLGVGPSESLVEYALDELSRVHLLEENGLGDAPVSRRDIVKRMALAGAAVVAIPVILSIATPTPAMALSGQNVQGQNNNGQ